MKKRFRVAVIVGTRPEAIKLAPVVQFLSRSKTLVPVTISTSQHGEMVGQTLGSFGITINHDLRVMRKAQTLWDLSGRLASRLGRFLDTHRVDAALVQGDTTSAFFGGLCSFYHHIPVGHVEAGLRTGNFYAPFPEEMNRRLLSSVATWHFAPTPQAAGRLRREGVRPTCHRRENHGKPMKAVARGLAELARANAEMIVLFPVHPNPAVRAAMAPQLQSIPNAVLCEPLDYQAFLWCLKRAVLVISDSGGVQEEATALGKPVVVLREQTERPEGIKAGALKLVGTDAGRLVGECQRLLRNAKAHQRICRASSVFGDGHAAERIVKILEQSLNGEHSRPE